jgi:hypothetical protein
MARPLDLLVVALNAFCVFSAVAIERQYCAAPLEEATGFMGEATLAYAAKYNPLFLRREPWLRVATCISAYGLSWGYAATLLTFLLGLDALRMPVLLFTAAKVYAIGFYWLMEFTSDVPPPDLLGFVGPEGPYVLSIVLVLWRLLSSPTPFARGARAKSD